MSQTTARFLPFLSLAAILLAASGCSPFRQLTPRMAFVPPSPAPPPVTLIAEPPAVQPAVYPPRPVLLLVSAEQPPPRSYEADTRIRSAEKRYQAGRLLYQNGDAEGARREFDRALDVLLSAPADLSDRRRVEERLRQLVESIYSLDVEGLGGGLSAQEPFLEASPLDEILSLTFPVDPQLKLRVREEVQATLSQLPLDVNDAVVGYVNYFSSQRGRRILISGLRRAGKYRDLIFRILDEEGVPRELIHLAQAESGFMPRAVSRKKATGMWQFMRFRGREYGLMQVTGTDDRMDPEKATRAAARHLRDLYEQFGDWYLAMAAYNCGPGRVTSAVERTGYADFWELRRRNVLPKETANYVPVILAMTIMAKNPQDYGLEEIDVEPPLEYSTVQVGASTHLSLIADIIERPLSEIRDLNPAILKSVVPAGYAVHVPKGAGNALQAMLNAIPASRRDSWRVHRVGAGETLVEIARRYKTTAKSISDVNGGATEDMEDGDLLMIPVAYQPLPAATAKKRGATQRKPPVRRTTSSTASTSSPGAGVPGAKAPQRGQAALHP